MNDLAIPVPKDAPPDLVSLSADELRGELTRTLRLTVDGLVRMAWIVRLLEERGEDLSDLKLSILGYLRKIAYGQVSAEAVVRFAERPTLLQRIASLPMPDQQRLAAGEPIKVLIRTVDGTPDHRLVDPTILTRNQLSQVFGPGGRLRDEAEQSNFLEDRRATVTKHGTTMLPPKLKADPARGGIRVGKTFVSTSDILEVLASMSAPTEDAANDDDRDAVIAVKLTRQQRVSVGIAANRAEIDMGTIIRRAMLICGLFGHE